MSAAFETVFDSDLAGGVVKVPTEGLARTPLNRERRLYQPAGSPAPRRVPLTAVPYAIWGNRGPGEMIVWIDSSF